MGTFTTSTAQPATSVTLHIILPKRSAPSSREREHGDDRKQSHGSAGHSHGERPPNGFHDQRKAIFRRAASRPMPPDVPSGSRRIRSQEGLRRRRLRRLYGVARREAYPLVPGARVPPRRARGYHL